MRSATDQYNSKQFRDMFLLHLSAQSTNTGRGTPACSFDARSLLRLSSREEPRAPSGLFLAADVAHRIAIDEPALFHREGHRV